MERCSRCGAAVPYEESFVNLARSTIHCRSCHGADDAYWPTFHVGPAIHDQQTRALLNVEDQTSSDDKMETRRDDLLRKIFGN